jgi:soluble P-type ATPase
MTRDEKQRLTAVEVTLNHHGELLTDIKKTVDQLHDASQRRVGADGERRGLVGWLKTALTLLAPLLSGAGGILIGKSH